MFTNHLTSGKPEGASACSRLQPPRVDRKRNEGRIQ